MKGACGLAILLLAALPATARQAAAPAPAPAADALRIATFNIWELSRDKLDQVDATGHGSHPQLRHAAEIVQRLRPDVLLVNEIDFDAGPRQNARLFLERYLQVPQGGQLAIDYPEIVFEAVNTGLATHYDLDHDGAADGPGDAHGFGRYPGQYGMALYSRLPVEWGLLRTFQTLRWVTMPGHLMPDGRHGRPAWYAPAEAVRLRLSSKSHWDVPLRAGGQRLHILACHPTPPVFDGDEDRNGRRNFDEIRLLADYLRGGETAAYIVDDAGLTGGLDADAPFVVLGDLNADPFNDAGPYGGTAIGQLFSHPRIQDPAPRSAGALHEGRDYPGRGDRLTSPYGRLDYVLPSRDLEVVASGVFWPTPDDPLASLVYGEERASDHHLVWVDVRLPAAAAGSAMEAGP